MKIVHLATSFLDEANWLVRCIDCRASDEEILDAVAGAFEELRKLRDALPFMTVECCGVDSDSVVQTEVLPGALGNNANTVTPQRDVSGR